MLHAYSRRVLVGEHALYTAICLPFARGLYLLAYRPKSGKGLGSVLEVLSSGRTLAADAIPPLFPLLIDLAMPKVRACSVSELSAELGSVGFKAKAKAKVKVKISFRASETEAGDAGTIAVVHAATLKWDEAGAESYMPTRIVLGEPFGNAAPPRKVVFDEPFPYAVVGRGGVPILTGVFSG
jgi:hypothetical protein